MVLFSPKQSLSAKLCVLALNELSHRQLAAGADREARRVGTLRCTLQEDLLFPGVLSV
jgi:hypothetical protein